MLARTPVAALLTTDNLIAWLRDQNQNQCYDYSDPSGCLLTQYLRAHNWSGWRVNPFNAHDRDFTQIVPLPEAFDRLAKTRPWTFGAALARLEARK